jgi:hypothetical protein
VYLAVVCGHTAVVSRDTERVEPYVALRGTPDKHDHAIEEYVRAFIKRDETV